MAALYLVLPLVILTKVVGFSAIENIKTLMISQTISEKYISNEISQAQFGAPSRLT